MRLDGVPCSSRNCFDDDFRPFSRPLAADQAKALGPGVQGNERKMMNTRRKCSIDHSGNRTLHETAGGWLECAGCGKFYGQAPVGKTTEQMVLPQPEPIAQPDFTRLSPQTQKRKETERTRERNQSPESGSQAGQKIMSKIKQPHQWTNKDGDVLILKRIKPNRKGYGEFIYPSGVGTVITAPDWNSEPKCGGGIHGWPWGFGLGEGVDYDTLNDIWLVLSEKPENVVGELEKGWKCKARAPRIVFEGTFTQVWGLVCAEQSAIIKQMARGPDSNLAASGDGSNLAASGDGSNLAASGPGSKLAASGYGSKLAASGPDSNLAASGYGSKIAASGDGSNLAASGPDSNLAASGNGCRAKAGKRGAMALAYWDEKVGWGFATGKVGDTIKENTWYEVEGGKLVECADQN